MVTINIFIKTVDWITDIIKWIGNITMALMMTFITFAVISRALNFPILGDVEIVQLGMIVLIMFSMAYAQREGTHLSIGLIVDRFSPRVQQIFNIFANFITILLCMLIGYVFVGDAMDNMLKARITSDLLDIPFFLFKFVVAIGFFMWGFQALVSVMKSLIQLKKGEFIQSKKEEGDLWL